MRRKGTISSWNDDKGFGFIAPQECGKKVFIHISGFGRRHYRPETGDVVSYELSTDKKGRPCAVNAAISGAKSKTSAARKATVSALLFPLAFVGGVSTSAITGHLPLIIVIAYAGLSLFTFVAYAIDKSAARRGAWRIREGTLHMLALGGGWPGALVAQQTLRHKSKKASFRTVFWVTVLVNCAALEWLHTESGTLALEMAQLQSFLEPEALKKLFDF